MPPAVQVEGLEWVRGDEEGPVGTADVVLRTWEDLALESRDRFAADLRAMGLPGPVVGRGLELRDRAAQDVAEEVRAFWQDHRYRYIDTPPEVMEEVQLVYNSARRSAWAQLRDWWLGRVTTVESRESLGVRLPLFLVAAPAAPGCSVEFTTGGSEADKIGWSLTIAGTGLGGEASINVATSATFEVASGQRKVIFLPLTVVLETVVVTEPGVAPLRRYRIDVAGLVDQRPAPGALLLASNALPDLGLHLETYHLAGDPTDSTATYAYTYEQKSLASLKVGIKTDVVELGLTSESAMQSSVALKFKLRSGRDYQLHQPADGDGVLWG